MVLPICENVSSKTVNYLSLPLSIIESADDSTYNFIFSKILSIYAKKRNILLKNENSLLVPHCLPFAFWKIFHFRIKLLHNEKNIKDLIVNSLNEKKYVYLCVNEEYIPQRPTYKKAYFYHELLIYGYEENTDKFYTIAFNENLSYVSQMIDSRDIINAYKTNKLRRFSFYNIWIRDKYDFTTLNKKLVKIKIFFYFHPIKRNYGYRAYDCLCYQLKKNYRKKPLDIRSFRTMVDRSLVFSKIKLIIPNLSKDIDDLIDENVLKSKLLMKNAIKYCLTQNEKIEPFLIDEIKKYSNNEQKILRFIKNNL